MDEDFGKTEKYFELCMRINQLRGLLSVEMDKIKVIKHDILKRAVRIEHLKAQQSKLVGENAENMFSLARDEVMEYLTLSNLIKEERKQVCAFEDKRNEIFKNALNIRHEIVDNEYKVEQLLGRGWAV